MYGRFTYLYFCVPCSCLCLWEQEKAAGSPGTSYRKIRAVMWVIGIELWYSCRGPSILNHSTISPAQVRDFLKELGPFSTEPCLEVDRMMWEKWKGLDPKSHP